MFGSGVLFTWSYNGDNRQLSKFALPYAYSRVIVEDKFIY